MQKKAISVKQLYAMPIDELAKLETVTVQGWIRTNRNSGNVGFVHLHDGTCFKNIQVVYSANSPFFAEVSK